ncbi:hypothetical protein LIER_11139 [Lithospermum erythrorhizon]|uniref:HMA domain-containing protein n=1 Tax=Lithospermum erythrorhizon TaxID=34254 RepID=A0AAV3PP99_LITER
MSKQDMLKIQNNVLRVNIHCDGCKHKVKKTLQKIEGVYKVSIDVDQGKVTVTGNVDSATLIRKLEKSGKHAELWVSQKNSNVMNNQFKNTHIDNFKGQKDNKSQKGSGKGHQQKGGQQPSQQQMMMPQKGGQQPSQQQMMMMQQMKNLNDFKGLQNGGQQPSQQQMMMMQQMKNLNDFKGLQNGSQQPSQQQMQMMMQQMKDLKDFKGHPKDQKSVKFNMHEHESDNYDDDEDDDFDSEFDDEEDYDDEFDDHAPLDKKVSGKKMNGHVSNDYGKMMGGGGNGKHGPNKIMNGHGPTDVKKKEGKKGGGGMAGMLKNLKGIGGKKDDKEQKGGKTGKGIIQNQVDKKGGKNGGGMPGKGKGGKNEDFGGKGGKSMGKTDFGGKIDGGFMMNKNPHGFQDINMNKKGGGFGGNMGPMGQMGPMGNHPMEQMRSFQAVQGFPAGGNGGGYFQGMGQGPPHGNNPYNQQQYMAQMMMNQQRGYGGHEMYQPMYAQPHPALMYGSPMAPPTENFSNMFNDENTSSCSIM